MRRGYSLILSLTVATMLTVILPLLEAQDSATNTAATRPSANSTLTPELMVKIIKLISVHGGPSKTPPPFASALGFVASGQSWENNQEASNETETGFLHTFAISRGSDQDVLLTVRNDNTSLLAFRAQRNGTLVSALSYDIHMGQLSMRTPAEAQADFSAECAFWTANVDSLIQQK